MRKLLLPLLLVFISALLPAAEMKSYVEATGGISLMHITAEKDELPLRTALSTEIRTAPLLIGSRNVKAGIYLDVIFQTPTAVHNSIRYDGAIRGGGGLLLTFRFTPLLTGELSAGTTIGRYLMSSALIASADASIALRLTPSELVSVVPRLIVSAESDRITAAFQIGSAVEIGWKR